VIGLLFTDIEGSTRLAAKLGSRWAEVLADHHAVVGGAIAQERGFVDGTAGDAFFATFADPRAAARAAVGALRGLRSHRWPDGVGELGVRMGLHVGFAERRVTGYVGLEVHRAARVAAAAHGGQLLLTAAARAAVGDVLDVELLGAYRLKDFPVAEQLFCAVVDGHGAASFPPPRTEPVRATNLPAGEPSLLAREKELGLIRAAFLDEGERLLTVTGRGGVGKTSLALAAAGGLLDEHSGGVWLVRLATVTAQEEVLAAAASTIGAEGDASVSAREALIERLRRHGAALLVLDNLEHLQGVGPALVDLLDALPQLRLLVSSQAPLRVAGERVIPLDPLEDEAALELISDCVARQGSSLSSAEADRESLLDVVHYLDGLPLALELAAARLAVLSPAQLRERLAVSPELLSDRGIGRPERQRSLGATVEWTLAALDAEPRALFVRMGVFAGPVGLADVESVAGGDGLDVLEALAVLVDVALVRRVESGDGRIRFGLPEALRQIAARMLDAAPDGPRWRHAHVQRQNELAWAAPLFLSEGAHYRAALAADAEMALALRWASANGDPLASSLAAARAALLVDTGRVRETFEALAPLLQEPSGDPAVDAYALTVYARALLLAGRMDESIAAADQAVAIASTPTSQVLALGQRGAVRMFRREYDGAVRDREQATGIARELTPAALCGALIGGAMCHLFAGNLDRAADWLSEGERVGAPVDARLLWVVETVRGDLAMVTGRPREAAHHYALSLEQAERRGEGSQVLLDLECVATAFAALEEDAAALEVIGLAEAQLAEVAGPASQTIEHLLQDDSIASAIKRVGADDAARLRGQGRTVPAERRVALASRLVRDTQPA